jgi:hypothetical protein
VYSYTLRLTGPGVPGENRLPGALVRDLFDALDRGAQGAVRLRLEGRSASRGPAPGWLKQAARFDVDLDARLPGGSIRLTAPTLGESLRDRFSQRDLFADPVRDETPVSLFTAGLADAVRGRRESDAFDDALLPAFEELGRVFSRNIDTIEIRNGHPDATPLTVTAEGIQIVEQIKRQIPRSQRVRIAGRLDTIRYSDRAFTLVLPPNGPALRGVFPGDDGGQLKTHFGQVVAVSAVAHFKPSGALRVIEADAVNPASEADLAVFSTVPVSMEAILDARTLRVPQGPRTGVNAIFGQWPGDESDEDILRILDELS